MKRDFKSSKNPE